MNFQIFKIEKKFIQNNNLLTFKNKNFNIKIYNIIILN